MSHRHIRFAGVLAVLCMAGALATTQAEAKQAPARPFAIVKAKAPEKAIPAGNQTLGVESGVVRSMSNMNYRVAPGSAEAMARQFLGENAAKLSLGDAQTADLVVRATRKGLAGTTVRFEQQVNGIPVFAPDIAVSVNESKRTIQFVANGYQPGIVVSQSRAAVGADQALASIKSHLGVTTPTAMERTRLVVVPDGKASRLAYEVRIVTRTEPHGDWQALVDATDGSLIQLDDISLYVNGSGFVFDPDPLSSAHVAYDSPGYTDGGDVTTAQLDAQRVSKTLLDITDLGGGTFKLQGPWAQVVDSESPFKGLFTQAGSTFNFDRAADNFEAVNCYWHIDNIMRHINNTLGVPVHPYQYAGGVQFDPSGFSGADNSHYLSGTGNLAFGEGGVDDAEDADVVIHELGHGLHDWLTAGSLSQVNGLSEGVGDIVCASYSRSKNQWLPADAAYNWTFNWDGHNPFWPGRVTNNPAHYPEGLDGEVHDDGEIWATCMMHIYDDIGRDLMEKALYEGLAMTNSSTNQDQAAQAVIAAAVSMGYSGAQISAMAARMQATGYHVSAGIDFVSYSLADQCSSNPGNVNGILEPGEAADINVTVVAPTLAQTGVSGILTTSTPGVSIINAFSTYPNLAPGVPTANNGGAFRILVDPAVACNSVVQLTLTLTSNEGGPFVMNFSRSIGSSLTPSGLPLAIPDATPAGVTSTLGVPSAQLANNIKVRVQITHTWVGDLFIKLRSPLGTEVVLLDRPGVPTSTFGCSNDNMDVTFDDASAVNLETLCPGTTPWLAGPGHPTGTLASFNGQSMAGDWVLTVSDNAGGDLGTVTSWSIISTPPLVGQCNICEQVVATRLAYFVAEDQADGISVAWEFSDASSIAGVTLERASSMAGPWQAIDAQMGVDGPHTTALDTSVRTDETYFYRLNVTERDGSRTVMDAIAARHAFGAIQSTLLLGASPNPAAHTTSLLFRLSQAQPVHLDIVDAQGRRVRTLQDGVLQAGEHARFWDGANESGTRVPAGLYFVVMTTREGRQSSRFAIVR